jgi:hypothetical protein
LSRWQRQQHTACVSVCVCAHCTPKHRSLARSLEIACLHVRGVYCPGAACPSPFDTPPPSLDDEQSSRKTTTMPAASRKPTSGRRRRGNRAASRARASAGSTTTPTARALHPHKLTVSCRPLHLSLFRLSIDLTVTDSSYSPIWIDPRLGATGTHGDQSNHPSSLAIRTLNLHCIGCGWFEATGRSVSTQHLYDRRQLGPSPGFSVTCTFPSDLINRSQKVRLLFTNTYSPPLIVIATPHHHHGTELLA